MIIDVPGWAVAVAAIVALYALIWLFGTGK